MQLDRVTIIHRGIIITQVGMLYMHSMPIIATYLDTLFYTCLQLHAVHHPYCYGYMLTYSLLWLPIQYGSLASLQCYLVCCTQLLHHAYTQSSLEQPLVTMLGLCYLLSRPMLLSALLAYSCVACLVYMAIQSAILSIRFHIAFYACLVSFSNIKSILPNKAYTT